MAIKKKPDISINFFFFFLSQAALNVGGYIQLLSVAALMMKLTNSGIKTGLTILCAPLPSLFLSLPAGCAGDRFSPKKLVIMLDILKGLLTLLFIGCRSPEAVIVCLLSYYTLDVFYNPARNKLLNLITPKERLITRNSILNGCYGLVSILFPALIGMFIHFFGVQKSFLLNSLLLLLSSFLISGIHISSFTAVKGRAPMAAKIAQGVRYCLGSRKLRSAIAVSALFDMCVICVNIAFYSLAFDKLKVSSGCWGLMLSTVYGMNVFAMILLFYKKKQFEMKPMKTINVMLLILSLIWLFYSVTENLFSVFIAEMAEGLCISLCSTLLITQLLKNTKNEYTARIMGIRDFCSNALKLSGMAFTYFFLRANPGAIFTLFAVILLLYSALMFFVLNKDNSSADGR